LHTRFSSRSWPKICIRPNASVSVPLNVTGRGRTSCLGDNLQGSHRLYFHRLPLPAGTWEAFCQVAPLRQRCRQQAPRSIVLVVPPAPCCIKSCARTWRPTWPVAIRGAIWMSMFLSMSRQLIAAAGDHTVTWVGTETKGRQLSSGVYFARLHTGEVLQTRKLLLIR